MRRSKAGGEHTDPQLLVSLWLYAYSRGIGSARALDDLFVQVLGMMSAEGLITRERVTLDGTKIKANAGANSFRRKQNWKRTWNWRRSKCVC